MAIQKTQRTTLVILDRHVACRRLLAMTDLFATIFLIGQEKRLGVTDEWNKD
ncbi:MAG: hypothetical protein ABTQ34_05025 [Bdellovibrionales bacterium]